MKLLQIGWAHDRNREFIIRACQQYNIEYHHTYTPSPPDHSYDIIWAPQQWINPDHYPRSKILFGPHFWVFPDPADPLFTQAKPEHASRCIYLCLSEWVKQLYEEFVPIEKQIIPHVAFPFGLDVPFMKKTDIYDYDCIVYYKEVHPSRMDFCVKTITDMGIRFRVFNYGSYSKDEYIQTLLRCRFAIWIGRHESQGFGLQECLATNTPIFIYDVKTMKEEYNNGKYTYVDDSRIMAATAAPYWSESCGVKVYSNEEFIAKLPMFINSLSTFEPAEYAKNTLTDRICFDRFLQALSLSPSKE